MLHHHAGTRGGRLHNERIRHQSLKDKQLEIRTSVTRSAEPPRHQVRQKDLCPRKEEPKQTEAEMVQRLAAAIAKKLPEEVAVQA